MKEFGPIHTLWSASEEDLVDTLKGVASCIDQCCKATEKRMAALSECLFPTIHEYMLYSEILTVWLLRCYIGPLTLEQPLWIAMLHRSFRALHWVDKLGKPF